MTPRERAVAILGKYGIAGTGPYRKSLAADIEQAVIAAVEEEREACAKIAADTRNEPGVEVSSGRVSVAILIHDKIRARKEH